MRETNGARVCVPVCVRRAGELRQSIERAAEVAGIIELRLDCLEADQLDAARAQLSTLLGATRLPFIITYRPQEQGGRLPLSMEERAAFWRGAPLWLRDVLGRERAFADLELDLLESPHAASLGELFARFQIICSHHDFQRTPSDLERIFERMARTHADILKIAVHADSITDCVEVMRLLERGRRESREIIAVSMGEAGLLTRVLAPAFGAFLTYGSLEHTQATAPGQVAARDLHGLYRVDEISTRTLITGLVGSPTLHSLSPHMHNAAFASHGLDAVYLPLEVEDLSAFVRRMADPRSREFAWNLCGLSITAPHKQAIIPYLDWVAPNVSRIGAVNTVVITHADGLKGFNTDADASVVPLAGLVELRGARVAVIGAGGAARALLWKLAELDARATVFARDAERGRKVAAEFAADDAPLDGAYFKGFDVVINATPLGTRGTRETEMPAVAAQLRGARVAYDLVYNPSETLFMREAREAGCRTIGGLGMLVAQAEEQFRLWTGVEPPPGVMLSAGERAVARD
ncbi:MAG: 3-dehydroquinate dehydratase / shikimate dehydrogenase [Acidobacteriota bacterium]|jgi:3-dehydroquinate dehydratase/shikimate dehydrogenase|nr:3-dehydroquinate dehydratase / shikimate dehydrogenase [Acidobacteriota bacterium]